MYPYNLLQTGFAGIWDNFSIDPAIALKDAEDNCFRSCSTSSFASNSLCTKVGFINFNFAGKRTMTLTFRDQLGTNFNKNIIDRPGADTLQSRAISSSQIQGKTLNQSSESPFCDSGTLIIVPNFSHIRSIAHF